MSWNRILDSQNFHRPRPTGRRAPGVTDVGVAFFIIVTAVAAFALVALLSSPAKGGEFFRDERVMCATDRDQYAGALTSRWDEQPLLEGATKNGGRAELFASGDRNWTFLVTSPRGWVCVYATGTALGPAINITGEGETP